MLGYDIALTTAQPTQHKRSRIENRQHHHELHTLERVSLQFQIFGYYMLDCALMAEKVLANPGRECAAL